MLDIETMHWISESVLTLTGIIVSGVAAAFNYREQFGWSPILLVTALGTGVKVRTRQQYASLSFEFWNRRTYPVVIRDMTVRVLGPEMPFWGEDGDPLFIPSDNRSASIPDGINYIEAHRVEPGSHLAFDAEVPFRTGYLSHAKFDWRIDVLYFDPISNKNITYKVLSKFSIERALHGVENQTRLGTK
jgi:hypothetical protein